MLKNGSLAETLDLTFADTQITVVNQINPTYMKATPESLRWLVAELYKNAKDLEGGEGSSSTSNANLVQPRNVVVEPDSEDEGEEVADVLAQIEHIKRMDRCT